LSLGGTATSNKNGYWTLGKQKNRDTGHKIYTSLRIYVPTNEDTKLLLERLQAEGGEDAKLHFRAKIQGSRIILTQVQLEAESSNYSPSMSERADKIIAIVAQLGGTTSWPTVREKLGLPTESMPGPFLVKQLRDRGMQTIKNPKTSTMTWKLIDREKMNGWTRVNLGSK
jgi:hypothetical protein